MAKTVVLALGAFLIALLFFLQVPGEQAASSDAAGQVWPAMEMADNGNTTAQAVVVALRDRKELHSQLAETDVLTGSALLIAGVLLVIIGQERRTISQLRTDLETSRRQS